MAFPISPAVVVREFSVDTIVPQVALTPAVIAGVFHWGPIGERILIDSEASLAQSFFKPSNLNAETWFSAANYLAYGGALWVSRAGDTTGSGNSTVSATVVNGNTTVTVGSTATLNAGQILYYSGNNSVVNPSSNGQVKISSVTNATAFVISTPGLANGTTSLTFRDDIVYSAVAQEVSTPNINWASQIVKNDEDYETKDGDFDSSVEWVARFPGVVGNSIRVAQCDTADQYASNASLVAGVDATASHMVANVGSNTIVLTFTPSNTASNTSVEVAANLASDVQSSLNVGDLIQVGNTKLNYQMLTVASVGSPATNGTTNVTTFSITTTDAYKLAANVTMTTMQRYWEFYNLLDGAPGQSTTVRTTGNTAANDEMHIVVVDAGGKFTGVSNTVLETYRAVSRATDAKDAVGQSLYYKDIINTQSKYVRWANDRSGAASATAALIASSTQTEPYSVRFAGGGDGLDEATVPIAEITSAYDLYQSPDDVDIGLVITGKARGISVNANTQLATYLIDNLAETRKDCVVFCSPSKEFVVNNKGEERNSITTARNSMPTTSYAFHDSGYKYQYDRYNDVYRWIPLNGDMAGLAARTDMTNDPWWSFAGLNRGIIKNCAKLAWNPRQADRDEMYKVGINSVITSRGQGFYLWGDKTMLTKTDPFDHINVRRLFIVLEKAISTAAKYQMFEFNDDFTRAQFRAMVNPFLKDVQGRRGIKGFYVQCNGENNPGSVVDANQFKGAIYIKPARSINTIVLDFVAVGTDVSFNEVLGRYGG